jgi:hypothetical protein
MPSLGRKPARDDVSTILTLALSEQTKTARKNARKRLSLHLATGCSSLQHRFARNAASFRLLQFAAAPVAGLLISVTWVRIPPGRCRICRYFFNTANVRDVRMRVNQQTQVPERV